MKFEFSKMINKLYLKIILDFNCIKSKSKNSEEDNPMVLFCNSGHNPILYPESLLDLLTSDEKFRVPASEFSKETVHSFSDYTSVILEMISQDIFEYKNKPSLVKFLQHYAMNSARSSENQHIVRVFDFSLDDDGDNASTNGEITLDQLSLLSTDTDFTEQLLDELSADSFLADIEDFFVTIQLFLGIDLYALLNILKLKDLPDNLYADTLQLCGNIFKAKGSDSVHGLLSTGMDKFNEFKDLFFSIAANPAIDNFSYI